MLTPIQGIRSYLQTTPDNDPEKQALIFLFKKLCKRNYPKTDSDHVLKAFLGTSINPTADSVGEELADLITNIQLITRDRYGYIHPPHLDFLKALQQLAQEAILTQSEKEFTIISPEENAQLPHAPAATPTVTTAIKTDKTAIKALQILAKQVPEIDSQKSPYKCQITLDQIGFFSKSIHQVLTQLEDKKAHPLLTLRNQALEKEGNKGRRYWFQILFADAAKKVLPPEEAVDSKEDYTKLTNTITIAFNLN